MDNLTEKTMSGGGDNEQIRQLLQENQQLLQEIYKQTEKTRKYIMAGRIISFIYLILIIAPLVFAAIYLPPLMKSYLAPYQELLGQTQNTDGLDTDAINDLLRQFEQR